MNEWQEFSCTPGHAYNWDGNWFAVSGAWLAFLTCLHFLFTPVSEYVFHTSVALTPTYLSVWTVNTVQSWLFHCCLQLSSHTQLGNYYGICVTEVVVQRQTAIISLVYLSTRRQETGNTYSELQFTLFSRVASHCTSDKLRHLSVCDFTNPVSSVNNELTPSSVHKETQKWLWMVLDFMSCWDLCPWRSQ